MLLSVQEQSIHWYFKQGFHKAADQDVWFHINQANGVSPIEWEKTLVEEQSSLKNKKNYASCEKTRGRTMHPPSFVYDFTHDLTLKTIIGLNKSKLYQQPKQIRGK